MDEGQALVKAKFEEFLAKHKPRMHIDDYRYAKPYMKSAFNAGIAAALALIEEQTGDSNALVVVMLRLHAAVMEDQS